MLDVLHRLEEELPAMLRDAAGWQSVLVNYHPPRVERLWRQWGQYRIYLHRIAPCRPEEALFHPHPWPSAMRVISGTYEMAVGYGSGEQLPPVAARIILGAGSQYEMTDINGWHSVRPIDEPTLSVMVTGTPWNRPSPKSDKPLLPLGDVEKVELLSLFAQYYNG